MSSKKHAWLSEGAAAIVSGLEARIAELEGAVLAEREACAKLADEADAEIGETGEYIAAAIRARPAP